MTANRDTPGAQGTVVIKSTKNNHAQVDVKVKSLARPSALTPPEDVYIVPYEDLATKV